MNSSLSQNILFVRPAYFIIDGLSEIPNSKYFFIIFIFIYIFAVCGNSIVLFMIFTEKSLHSPKNMGIFNLALADFGKTNSLIPNMLKTLLFESPYISYDGCMANMYGTFFFGGGQTLTLAALAYDRFVAICIPLRYHAIVTHSFMTGVITVIWSILIVYVSTMVAFVMLRSYCKSIVIKSFFCDHGPVYRLACDDISLNLLMSNIGTVIFMYAPFITIVLSYSGIVLAMIKITTWQARFKALKTCSSHLITVGIAFLPTLGVYTAALTSTIQPTARIINTSISMNISPMCNPLIYVLSTKEFRCVIMKMLRKKDLQLNRKPKIFSI